MILHTLPLLICAIVIKRAFGYEDWDGTMVTSPALVTENLFNLRSKLYSKLVQVKRGGCRDASITRCTCFEVLGTTKRRISTTAVVDVKKSFREASKIHHPDKGGKAEDFAFLSSCHNNLVVPGNLHNYSTLLQHIEANSRAWFRRNEFRNGVERLNQQWIVANRDGKPKRRPPRQTQQECKSNSGKAKNPDNSWAKRHHKKRCCSRKNDGLLLFLCFVVFSSAVLARLGFFAEEKDDSSAGKTRSYSLEETIPTRTLAVLNPEAEEARQLGASLEVIYVDGPYEDDDCSLQSTESARVGYPLAPR